MAKIALLIGVSEYEPGLNPLPAAVKDVEAMRRVLVHPEMGGFAEADITVLKNPQKYEMETAIYELFADRKKDDLLLFYFSGHGITDQLGQFYLATRSTRKSKANQLIDVTAVAASFLHQKMSNSRSEQQVVILDCCFSGAFAKGMTAKGDDTVNIQIQLGGKGRAVLASSTSTQYSFEHKDSGFSIYTHYLLEGIEQGKADGDSDGWISVDELHEYASDRVKKYCLENDISPPMTPEIYAVKEGYKIHLAKAPIVDVKRIYLQEAKSRLNQGKFSRPAQRILKNKQLALGLSEDEAAAILKELMRPYQEYEEALIEAVNEEGYPLSKMAQKDLKDYQKILGLRDEDVAPIEERIIGKQKATSTASIEQPPVLTKAVQANHSDFTEDLGNGVTLEMVAIPGGTFLMGSPSTEAQRKDDENPQHSVTVAPFFMGKFAVTQAQWHAVASLPQVKHSLNPDPSGFKRSNHPVEQISWFDAVEFCERLSKKTELTYRLPSEAEWEYACRAGTTTPFHFGQTITTTLANYDGNYTYGSEPKGKYRQQTTDVGSFQVANAFGLYDMHGNVWEWCADHWQSNYKGAPSDGSAWLSNNDNQYRLLRGGSWSSNPWDCRSAHRNYVMPDSRVNDLGLRVVGVRA